MEDKDVCSGHGSCIDYNTCLCPENKYFGMDCNITKCYGVFANESVANICSGHGNCTSYDNCECLGDYYGNNCDGIWEGDWLSAFYYDNCEDKNHIQSPILTPLRNNSCSMGNFLENSRYIIFNESDIDIEYHSGSTNCSSDLTADFIYGFDECEDSGSPQLMILDNNHEFKNFREEYGDDGEDKDSFVVFRDSDNSIFSNCDLQGSLELLTVVALFGCDYDLGLDSYLQYSVDPDSCDLHLKNYSDDTCTDNNNGFDYTFVPGDCYPSLVDGFDYQFGWIYGDHFCMPDLFGHSDCSKCMDRCFGIPRFNDPAVCSGHGECIGTDICVCDDNYYGLNCNITTCFGIFSNDTNGLDCGNYGSCDDYDHCDCSQNYFGDFCNITTCFGGFSNETSNLCNPYGVCVTYDHCECDDFYYGDYCNVSECFGILSNDSLSCGNHGVCSQVTDKCDCFDYYFGEFCNITTCYNYFSNETKRVCSNHGDCEEYNSCECEDNYYGLNCNISKCQNIYSNQSEACGDHGKCGSYEHCICDKNYYGQFCNISKCYGILANESYSCGENGECRDFNWCHCDDYFHGHFCNITECHGELSNMSTACGVHGYCDEKDHCGCDDGYYGKYCEVFTCYGILNNDTSNLDCGSYGDCFDNDYCRCHDDYYGKYCNITTCYSVFSNDSLGLDCGSHGNCIDFNDCDCDDDWEGQKCDVTICHGILSNDSNSCGPNGECKDYNHCECKQEYYHGKYCNITQCYGILPNESLSCHNHGECLEYDSCHCSENFYGLEYNITDCFGKLTNSSSVCSTHGDCLDYNKCNCTDGFFGDSCQHFFCKNIPSNRSDVCNYHGNCSSPNQCECESDSNFEGNNCDDCIPDYFGIDCDIPICHGVLANYTTSEIGFGYNDDYYVCSGHGSCNIPNLCECDQDEFSNFKFIGGTCDTPMCYLIDSEDDNVCSGHGECEDFNDCGCAGDYYGSTCLENFKRPEFTDSYLNQLIMTYFLSKTEFLTVGKHEMTENSFNCSKIIKNWNLFLTHNSSYCSFEFLEIISGYFVSINLIINIADLNEIYGPDFKLEDNQRRAIGDLEPLINYEIPDNFTIEIITITIPEQIIDLKVVKYLVEEEEEDDDDNNNNNNNNNYNNNSGDEIDLTWLYVSLPTTFVLIIIISTILLILLICSFILCVCFFCCFLCFVLILGVCLCIFGGGCSSTVLLSQKKKLTKFKELDNFDLLLKEQELEKTSTNPKIKINKELFEIDASKLKLLSIVGEGGSDAVVYKADWNGKIVAFKCFKSRNVCGDQVHFDEFEREANLLASISHPNIIQFFGSCLKPPRIGFLMEFCENGDLSDYIVTKNKKEEVFLFQEKIRIFIEICSGMAYLHERKIIHRDLKTENVLLDSNLNCKIMDFGISRIFDATKQAKTKGVGTSIYISPEMILGSTYNQKIDVFSFGILLWILYYENLSPYGEDTIFVENKVASNPYFRPPFEDENENNENNDNDSVIPEWLRNLITSCLEHEPIKRKSFKEIIDYLIENSKEKKAVLADGENENNNNNEDIITNKPIFIYIKLKNQNQTKAERFFLMKRTYDCLFKIVQEKYPNSEIRKLYLNNSLRKKTSKKKGDNNNNNIEVVEVLEVEEEQEGEGEMMKKNSLFIPIENDEDVKNKLRPNCLIDVDEFDERDTLIINLKKEKESVEEKFKKLRKKYKKLKNNKESEEESEEE